MNIDTLKCEDGTFRNAHNIDIERCLNAGHTTHLQTSRGTMAFRPFNRDLDGDSGWIVDRAVAGITDREQTKNFKSNERDRLIRAALNFLNGTVNPYQPDDMFSVYANQAERDGYVLAVIGDEVLVEYEMPGRFGKPTSALRIVKVLGYRMVGNYKSVSYNAVPKKWLRAIEEAGMTNWIGMGQRSATRIPFPSATDET